MSRIGALVLGLSLVSAGGTARACYDGEESNSYEEESRPGYGGPIDMAGSATLDDGRQIPYSTLMAAGAIMLTGSVVLIAKQTRAGG